MALLKLIRKRIEVFRIVTLFLRFRKKVFYLKWEKVHTAKARKQNAQNFFPSPKRSKKIVKNRKKLST